MVADLGARGLAPGPVRGGDLGWGEVVGCPVGGVRPGLPRHQPRRRQHHTLDFVGVGSQALHLDTVGVVGVPAGELEGLLAHPAVALAVQCSPRITM